MTLGGVVTFCCLYNVTTSHNLCKNNTLTQQAAAEVVLHYPCSPFMVMIVIPLWSLPET